MSNNSIFAIYGASGCGRGIMPLAREQLQRQGLNCAQLVFIDDQPQAEQINGRPVLRYTEFLACAAKERYQSVEQPVFFEHNKQRLVVRRGNRRRQLWDPSAVRRY